MNSDHIKRLDRLAGPTPEVDPVKVQGEVNAYLRQRGQDLARDMDLGQVKDEDLVELGRLDVIAQDPDLDPDLAVALAMFEPLKPPPGSSWAEQQERHRGHRHAVNVTCTEEASDYESPASPASDQVTAPDRTAVIPMGRPRPSR